MIYPRANMDHTHNHPFDLAITLPDDIPHEYYGYSAGDVLLFQTAKEPVPGALCLCERSDGEVLAVFGINAPITSDGEVLPRQSVKAVGVRLYRDL